MDVATRWFTEQIDTAAGFVEAARDAYAEGDLETAQGYIGEVEAALESAREVIDAQEALAAQEGGA